jgi:hypothetical protein
MMQTDVKAATLLYSGLLVNYPTRIKGISVKGTTSAGAMELFDSLTAPVSATYGRSGTTITVTKSSHGLNVGDPVGISFAANSGAAATSGNYKVATVPTDGTFTVTDINSGTVNAGGTCLYASKWIITFRFADGDVYTNYWEVPGEGIRVDNGVYNNMTDLTAVSIFYG